MNKFRIVAPGLIIAGVLGVVYGRFTFDSDTHRIGIGGLQLSVAKKETVNIPVWFGAGVIVLGTLMLVVPRIKS